MVRRGNSVCNVQERIICFQLEKSAKTQKSKSLTTNGKTDTNNNVIESKLQHRLHALMTGRDTVFVTDDSAEEIKKPSYIPSYVRNVSFERRKPTYGVESECIKNFSNYNFLSKRRIKSDCNRNYKPCQDLMKLREKYRRLEIPEIRVKETVATMEARISASNSRPAVKKRPVKPSIPTKPVAPAKPTVLPKPVIRSHNDPVENVTRKALHRRSMSDPNIQKAFFQAKQMWEQKAETKTSIAVSEGNRCGKISSANSTSLNQNSRRKTSNSNENEIDSSLTNVTTAKNNSIPPTKPSKPQGAKKTPAIPPRPKGRQAARKKSLGQLLPDASKTSEKSLSQAEENMIASEAPLPQAENLSVSEKAMIFGGKGTQSVTNNMRQKQSDSRSPGFQRHRRSWSNESMTQAVESKKKTKGSGYAYNDAEYTRQRNDSELSNSPRFPNRKKRDVEEEERIVSDLRKNAKLAKERRKRRPSLDSPTAASDEEEIARKNSLPIIRRRSKDSIKSSLSDQAPQGPSPMAVRKTEESIFGAAPAMPRDHSKIMADEAEFKGRRRASSLQRLMEKQYNYHSPISTPLGGSPILKRSVNKITDHNCPKVGTPVRPTDLPLNQERTDTEQSKVLGRALTEQKENKSISAGLTSDIGTSPTTPDNRSSGFSEEDSFPSAEILITTSPPPQPPPRRQKSGSDLSFKRDAEKKQTEELTPLSSTNTTATQKVITLTDFNPLEEYNKIAKQINEDDETLSSYSQRRPISGDFSITSVDSGFRNSLEVPSGRDLNDRWSDFELSDDEEEHVAGTPNKTDLPRLPSPGLTKETAEVKLHNIAKELLSTEESYVKVLHLIDQVFHKQVMEASMQNHILPKQVVENIFSHISSIYQFHSRYLLPQLQERLENWETKPAIGDIMTEAAPFLKMYGLYVQHFDEALNTIRTWSEKSSAFSAILKSIQKTPECQCLTLEHHMLSPVQRVPRYRLLLEDYVKRLPDVAEDREKAVKALDLITVAATHSNETMRKMERFQKLINVQNSLTDVNFDIVDASRELLKSGKIIKISARNGEKYERYLYLLSDMLLCCTPIRRLQSKTYKVNAKIDLDGMEITEVKNPSIPNTFCVSGLQKSMEFATNNVEDKDSWVKAIQCAIEERRDRLETFRSFGHGNLEEGISPCTTLPPNGSPFRPPSPSHSKQPVIEIDEAELGKRAPRWIKDHEVAMCMCCSKAFSRLLRRRHHCRACGRVVCSECSEHKTMLQYEPGKPQKVCATCYNVLRGRNRSDSIDVEKKGVLEVEADAVSGNSVIANYLFFTENIKKRSWTRTWCAIPNGELCLYFYRAHQDARALMTMPLPGFEVRDIDCSEYKYCFKLKQARKIFLFGSDDQDCVERWKYALRQGSKGEDLTREDVYRLGKRPQERPSSSEESAQDNEEENLESEQQTRDDKEESDDAKEHPSDHKEIDKVVEDDNERTTEAKDNKDAETKDTEIQAEENANRKETNLTEENRNSDSSDNEGSVDSEITV